MENASKALIMAAGVLVGVLILSLAVYLIVTFGSESAQLHQQVAADQLNQFNSQYTTYQGSNATIYDVVTVANMATENNINYDLDSTSRDKNNTYYISVLLQGESYIEGNLDNINNMSDLNKKYEGYINQDLNRMDSSANRTVDALPKYNCTVNISQITGRVYKVVFTKT